MNNNIFVSYSVASAFGEPHAYTFDGLPYTFKGKGEYDMVVSTNPNLRIQCRTSPFYGMLTTRNQIDAYSDHGPLEIHTSEPMCLN